MVCSVVLLCGMGGHERCLIGTSCGSSLDSLLCLVETYFRGWFTSRGFTIASEQSICLSARVLALLLDKGFSDVAREWSCISAVIVTWLGVQWDASLLCQEPAWNGGGAGTDSVCSMGWDSFQLAFNDVKMSGSFCEHLRYEYISSLYLIFPSSEMNEFQEE